MSVRYASMALAAAALLAGATQVWSQAGADAPAPPAPRGGAAPMPKPVTLVDRPNASGGEALYVEFCAMCHAPNGMGHGLLGRRMDTPDLEKRGRRKHHRCGFQLHRPRSPAKALGQMPLLPGARMPLGSSAFLTVSLSFRSAPPFQS